VPSGPQTHQTSNTIPQGKDSPQEKAERAETSSPCLAASPPAAARPLSPQGRLVKRQPAKLTTHSFPDFSAVKSRYLELPEPPESTYTGLATSPKMSPARRAAHSRYWDWRLGKMHRDVPDYRHSQPRMSDRMHCLDSIANAEVVTLKQVHVSTPASSCVLPRICQR
jgi:hypothetical protein